MSIEIITGDLLSATTDYIAHQCNATHNRNLGLSSLISKRYPKANIYNGNFEVKHRTPGSIIVRDNVIAMIAQVSQGKPKAPESKSTREKLFQQCLEQISTMDSIKSVAFPYGIGCGLAGGDWNRYFSMIQSWSTQHPTIQIKIYKLN